MDIMTATAKRKIISAINENIRQAFDLNYFLADNPEISGKEYIACETICALLEKNGIETERNFAGLATAFRGTIKSDPESDIRIAIIAEYDALPEIGHACGHCASCSVSVLAAIALKQCAEMFEGNIDIIGTPDEEASGSKIVMTELGVFDKYDFVIMLHMGTMNMVEVNLLALSAFHYIFKGCPSHAASSPWEGKNALNGAMLMIHAFDMLRQHIKPAARIHGILLHAGDASNIVPEQAVAEYTARYPDSGYLDVITGLMHDCAVGAAMATQTKVDIVQYAPKLDSFKPNLSGNVFLQETFEEVGLQVHECPQENAVSSDIGNVSFRCAAFHPTIAVSDKAISLHTREFAAKMKEKSIEKVIDQGAQIIALMIMRTLTEPELIRKIREDFQQGM